MLAGDSSLSYKVEKRNALDIPRKVAAYFGFRVDLFSLHLEGAPETFWPRTTRSLRHGQVWLLRNEPPPAAEKLDPEYYIYDPKGPPDLSLFG